MTSAGQILTVTAFLLSAIIGVASTLNMGFVFRKRKKRIPKWQAVGKVKNLYIYPLKGGDGMEVDFAICSEFGLQTTEQNNYFQIRDKNFLVYDANTKEILTAETHPPLTDILLTAYDEDNIVFDVLNQVKYKIRIPTQIMLKQPLMVTYKGEEIPTIDCQLGSVWISSYILERPNGLRLAFFDSAQKRNIFCNQEIHLFCEKLKNDISGKYLDLTGYLMINQSSINKLSRQLNKGEVGFKKFRPNILIEDDGFGYDEDNWRVVKIGDAVFDRNDLKDDATTRGKIKRLKEICVDEGSSPIGAAMRLKKWGSISVGDTVFVKRF